MPELAKKHHAELTWDRTMGLLSAEIGRRRVHPTRVIVLLPFAQLMAEAARAWQRRLASTMPHAQFSPRFETTSNWARSLGAAGFDPNDLRLDAAYDVLTASTLLKRSGLGEHQEALTPKLMEAAWSLAGVGAAVLPVRRAAWAASLAPLLTVGMAEPLLSLEAAAAQLALAWVGGSNYPTDLVFSSESELLVVLEGFQDEGLTQALLTLRGNRAMALSLLPGQVRPPIEGQITLHAAQDLQDEAERAGACVLNHIAAGHAPVALVAQDRLLTRRVRAMLAERGVSVRDETGWTLSTTRAAASLMALLRSCLWDASADQVLDWLKHAPAFDAAQVSVLETRLRRRGVRAWQVPAPDQPLELQIQSVRDSLQSARPLSQWLAALRLALQASGQWLLLLEDAAGQAALDILRLRQGAEHEFDDVPARMGLPAFIGWVTQTLESVSFSPPHPAHAQVHILPLTQLLGGSFTAGVFPGCDEVRLPVSPEPPGPWTPAQRLLLGLPSRERLALALREAWHYALQFPYIDILWRTSEGGESLLPSGLVQQLQLDRSPVLGTDPRALRRLLSFGSSRPQPSGQGLPLSRLSSSAYEDLRRCPYRFFALRLLRLQEADELDAELDKRDFGNWLHAVLGNFHEAVAAAPPDDMSARLDLMQSAAEKSTLALGLSPAEFLPFASAWPRIRAGYLAWLAEHEAAGACFSAAEVWREQQLGQLTLVGQIDRVDRLADGSVLVLDYKTEGRQTTLQRIKMPSEDTQLAFYAALLGGDAVTAVYVNISEKEGTRSYGQPDIEALRTQLLAGITSDLARMADGAVLPALGAGQSCDYCAARGLCRKDFWHDGLSQDVLHE
jgi:ATP-dependent helicase/nuclease subunit B